MINNMRPISFGTKFGNDVKEKLLLAQSNGLLKEEHLTVLEDLSNDGSDSFLKLKEDNWCVSHLYVDSPVIIKAKDIVETAANNTPVDDKHYRKTLKSLKNELENDKKNMALFDQGIGGDEITGTNWMRRYHSTKFDMAAFLKCFTKKTNLSKLITKKENAVNKKMTEHISDIARLNAEYYKNKSSFEERLHKLFD